MRLITVVFQLLLAGAICAPVPAIAKGGHHYTSHSSSHYRTSTHYSYHSTTPGVRRDSRGRIARSSSAKTEFKKMQPCPATGKSTGACPGYVIDHVVALKRGGADAPSNMQWQTKAAARAKDRWE